jgi:hypothetical protein
MHLHLHLSPVFSSSDNNTGRMKLKILLALDLVSHISLSAALSGPQIARDLRSILSPGTGIFLPTDTNWANETTQRFQAWSAPSYVVSIKPAVKGDVQKVVSLTLVNLYSESNSSQRIGQVCCFQ